MIGFLGVSIDLILWTVSAVSFWFAGGVFMFLYKYDLDAFVGSFLIVLVPLGVIFGCFWVSVDHWGSWIILGCLLGPRRSLGSM